MKEATRYRFNYLQFSEDKSYIEIIIVTTNSYCGDHDGHVIRVRGKREKNLHKRDSMKKWHRMKMEVQLFYVFST